MTKQTKKNNSLQPWLAASRPKTLALAIANTIIGSALAAAQHQFSWTIFALAAFTTILLQILTNLANDYGDFVNGKDNAERIGPKRMLQSGNISRRSMLRGMMLIGVLCASSGLALIWVGTQGLSIGSILAFGAVGLAAIAAAIKYTVGKNPFGYRGLGDMIVFVFFGLVGVVGTYFLHTQSFEWSILLPASAMGLLSTGVLNMNNMRDYESDKNSGKRTIVVSIGPEKAAHYHLFLLAIAAILAIVYTFINFHSQWQWLFLLSFPLLILNLKKVFNYKNPLELYPELGRLSMASLIFAITFSLGLIL